MKQCDLHSHSSYSDGSLTPEELILLAKKNNLTALALTDHNSIKGLKEFTKAGKKYGVEAIPGIEISTDHYDDEIHIVGLFLTEEQYDDVAHFVERNIIVKYQSNISLINNLRKAGYDITYDEAVRFSGTTNINRANIAKLLVKKGMIGSVSEAFNTILDPSYGFYTKEESIYTIEAIEFLNSIGAVSVWAHPFFKMKDKNKVLKTAKEFQSHGLTGIEVLYSTFTQKETDFCKEIIKQTKLLPSGGSDYHGESKPDIQLGCGHGNLIIPYEYAENLKNTHIKKS